MAGEAPPMLGEEGGVLGSRVLSRTGVDRGGELDIPGEVTVLSSISTEKSDDTRYASMAIPLP